MKDSLKENRCNFYTVDMDGTYRGNLDDIAKQLVLKGIVHFLYERGNDHMVCHVAFEQTSK